MEGYRWVPTRAGNPIPEGAFAAGVDLGGTKIIAGRAFHEGDLLPAKIIPTRKECFVSYGGKEISKDVFEVLVPDGAILAWQASSNGQVPSRAIAAGRTSAGEVLYYGRVFHGECVTPGKVQPSHSVCYYPFDGEEKKSSEYEVLVH